MTLEEKTSLSENYSNSSKTFLVAGSLYLLAGLADGLLTVKGLNSGIASDLNPLANLLTSYYGIGTGIAITKSNALVALMASEIIERRASLESQKNLTHYFLYGGVALSLAGIAGWLSGFA